MIQRDFRDVMMENKNGYAKLVADIFKKEKIPPRSQANSLELESMLDVF